MIGRKDLFLVFICLKLISVLGILPIQFSMRTGKVRVLKKGPRYLIWKYWWFPHAILYWFYMLIRIIQSFMGHYVEFQHLAYHIALVCFSTIQCLWSVILFLINPEVTEALFNLCSDQIVEQGKAKRSTYSTQEWLLIILPIPQIFVCIVNFIALYTKHQNSLQFLNSLVGIPELIPLLIPYELCNVNYYLCANYFAIYIQLALLQNINDSLQERIEVFKSIMSNSEEGQQLLETTDMDTMVDYCKFGREIQLKLNLFNLVNALIIYTYKVNLIICAVANWFFGIRHLRDADTEFAVSCLFLAVYLTFLFIIIYDKAFAVPGWIEDYKIEAMLVTTKILEREEAKEVKPILNMAPKREAVNENSDFDSIETVPTSAPMSAVSVGSNGPRSGGRIKSSRNCGMRRMAVNVKMKTIQRHLRSIPNVGIKMGDFQTMERDSTPNFVDFITGQVVDLLITFP